MSDRPQRNLEDVTDAGGFAYLKVRAEAGVLPWPDFLAVVSTDHARRGTAMKRRPTE
jgi:hypothetical protein